MKFKWLYNDGIEGKFVIEGINYQFANALRRAIISEVKTYAIEDVTIVKNTSAMYDEILAHRLALLPIKVEKGVEGKIAFKLKASGPKMVYAKDIVIENASFAFPEMPIVELLEGQEIEIHGYAVEGKGKEHAKWQPAYCYYYNYPIIKVPSDLPKEKAKEIAEKCPKKVFSFEDGKLKVVAADKCTLCMQCNDIANKEIVKLDENKFIFYIESFGQMSVKEIVKNAIAELKALFKELEEKIIKE